MTYLTAHNRLMPSKAIPNYARQNIHRLPGKRNETLSDGQLSLKVHPTRCGKDAKCHENYIIGSLQLSRMRPMFGVVRNTDVPDLAYGPTLCFRSRTT